MLLNDISNDHALLNLPIMYNKVIMLASSKDIYHAFSVCLNYRFACRTSRSLHDLKPVFI